MCKGIHVGAYTLSVTPVQSRRCKIAVAILTPVCFSLSRWKLISAALSPMCPLEALEEIQ
jgi:hypothetical protein